MIEKIKRKIKKYRSLLFLQLLFFMVGVTMWLLPSSACQYAYMWGMATAAIAMFLGKKVD